MVAKEQRVQEQQVDVDDEVELERTIEKAHQLEQDSQRVVATGEVWRAQPKKPNSKSAIHAPATPLAFETCKVSLDICIQPGSNGV
jgi:hypothetical protein